MPLFKEVNLTFKEGDKVALTGESGSGKTTFLKLLNGLYNPSFGRVLFKEKDLSSHNPGALRASLFFLQQESPLFTHTIREELDYIYQLERFRHLAPKSEEEKAFILELCQLRFGPNQGTENFSGGEKQRLCLARTLLPSPQAVLLDEPTSALDLKTGLSVMKNLFENFPRTLFIFVTHQKEIMALADTVLRIEGGKIIVREQKPRVEAIS